MSPGMQKSGKKVAAPNNVYTAILALTFCVLLATAAFMAYKCYVQYGVIIKIQ